MRMIKKYLKKDICLLEKDKKLLMIEDRRSKNKRKKRIMQYQKILNLLENTRHQKSEFRTKNWVEVNDESSGRYMLTVKSNLKLRY